MSQLLYLLIFLHMAAVCSYKSILLSSFSSVNNQAFRDLAKLLIDGHKGKEAQNSLVYIPTATYVYDPTNSRSRGEQRRRARYDARQKMEYIRQTLSLAQSTLLELDSQDILSNRAKAEDLLKKARVVYVDGGNTFYLQKCLLQSNFWDMLEDPLADGRCTYMGCSAGAIVAGLSASTAYWKGWDDPNVVGDDFCWSESNLKGRGLVDSYVFPHFDQDIHTELVSTKAGETSKEIGFSIKMSCISNSMANFIGFDSNEDIKSILDQYKSNEIKRVSETEFEFVI